MGWNYVTFPNSTVVPLKFGNRLVISFEKFKTKRFRLCAHLPFWIWARDIASLPLLFGISSVRNFIPVRTRYCITCLFWNRQMQWTVIYLVVIACNIYRGLLQDCISPASSNWKGVMQSSPISEYHCAIFILASTGGGRAVPMTNVLNTYRYYEMCRTEPSIDVLREDKYRLVSVLIPLSKIYESGLNHQLLQQVMLVYNAFLSTYRNVYTCHFLLVNVMDD